VSFLFSFIFMVRVRDKNRVMVSFKVRVRDRLPLIGGAAGTVDPCARKTPEYLRNKNHVIESL